MRIVSRVSQDLLISFLSNYDFPDHAFGVDDISTAQSVAA
jgi:hypothetical protein